MDNYLYKKLVRALLVFTLCILGIPSFAFAATSIDSSALASPQDAFASTVQDEASQKTPDTSEAAVSAPVYMGNSLVPKSGTASTVPVCFNSSGDTMTASFNCYIANSGTDYPYKFTISEDCTVTMTGSAQKSVTYNLRAADNTKSLAYQSNPASDGLPAQMNDEWDLPAGTYYIDFISCGSDAEFTYDFTLTATPN